jgi:hypothetical protein
VLGSPVSSDHHFLLVRFPLSHTSWEIGAPSPLSIAFQRDRSKVLKEDTPRL